MPPISGSQNKQVSSLNNSSNSICFRRQLAFKSLWKRRDEEDEGEGRCQSFVKCLRIFSWSWSWHISFCLYAFLFKSVLFQQKARAELLLEAFLKILPFWSSSVQFGSGTNIPISEEETQIKFIMALPKSYGLGTHNWYCKTE